LRRHPKGTAEMRECAYIRVMKMESLLRIKNMFKPCEMIMRVRYFWTYELIFKLDFSLNSLKNLRNKHKHLAQLAALYDTGFDWQ
jgi:hypothetical protein